MNKNKENLDESERGKQAGADFLNQGKHAIEITGLGLIGVLILAIWPLVGDGTLRLNDYLVFVAFLLVSASGLVWRLMYPAAEEPAERPRTHNVDYWTER
jgi:uncharacterized membrane protein YqjE